MGTESVSEILAQRDMGLQNITDDKEIRELSQDTSIESLSKTLEDRLPGT